MQTIILAYTLLVAASGLLTQVQNSPNIPRETVIQAQTTAQNAINFATYVIQTESQKNMKNPVTTQKTLPDQTNTAATGSAPEICSITPTVEISPAYGGELGYGGKTNIYAIRVTGKSTCGGELFVDYTYGDSVFKDIKLPFNTQVFSREKGTYRIDFTVHNKDNTVSSTTSVTYEGGEFIQ